ncbi:hypothetical protein MJG53_009434 [Ovis ammon polii x Ovis aries]|uniref:Uncharacterized protein n=1 Tax=Ovis ammon polii x Ovis aries TaxID=2918886 RepID=A0ACB9UWK9_9CETA|nr:hypothetical protein MJG53_009434 [Ovis ammon polii x Ovis aries]
MLTGPLSLSDDPALALRVSRLLAQGPLCLPPRPAHWARENRQLPGLDRREQRGSGARRQRRGSQAGRKWVRFLVGKLRFLVPYDVAKKQKRKKSKFDKIDPILLNLLRNSVAIAQKQGYSHRTYKQRKHLDDLSNVTELPTQGELPDEHTHVKQINVIISHCSE